MASGGYRPEIDGMRSIAVMAVVLDHVDFHLFEGGFVGVDVFFVISGYLITKQILAQLAAGSFSLSEFYVRRIRRLFPALAVTVLATLVAFAFIAPLKDLEKIFHSSTFSIFSLANFYFLSEVGYFDTEADFKPLLHTWSLSVEEQFYLLWPALLIALFAFRKPLIPAFIGVGIIVSLAAAEAYNVTYPSAVYYMLPFRIFELFLGAGVVFAERRFRATGYWSPFLSALGIIAILVPTLLLDENDPFPGALAIAPCLGAALVIFAGDAPYIGRLLTNSVTIYLGKISYSLYLVHWPIFVFWRYVTSHEWTLAEKALLIAAAIGAAHLLHTYVEKVFRFPASAAPKNAQPKPAAQHVSTQQIEATSATKTISNIKGRAAPNRNFLLASAFVAAMCAAPSIYTRVAAHVPMLSAKAKEKTLQDYGTFTSSDGIKLSLRKYHSNAAGQRALLIGDSHANHFYYGLGRAFHKRDVGLDMSFLSGCPPVFGVWKSFGDGEGMLAQRQDRCRSRKGAWEELVQDPRYDVVFLAARWFWLFEPTEQDGFSFRRDYLIRYEDENAPRTVARSKELFETHLRQTIERLHSLDKKVVIISQVPPIGNNISRCGKLAPFVSAAQSGRCRTMSYPEQEARGAYTNRVIAEIANEYEGVKALIPQSLMCTEQACMVKSDEGKILYNDNNHLTRYGSSWLVARANTQSRLIDQLVNEMRDDPVSKATSKSPITFQ